MKHKYTYVINILCCGFSLSFRVPREEYYLKLKQCITHEAFRESATNENSFFIYHDNELLGRITFDVYGE